MSPLHAPLEETPAAASVFVPSTVAMDGTQVVSVDPVTDKRNAFLSLVFWPLSPPILATPGPSHARAPMEVASTPCWSGRIMKQNQKRKDATTQELLAHTLGPMSTYASVLVDSVGPPSAEVCRRAVSFS
jgi:hypothetical protein